MPFGFEVFFSHQSSWKTWKTKSKTKFSRYWNSCETDKLYKDYKHIELWGSSRISGQCVTWVKPKTFLYRQNVWAPTIFRSLDTGYYLWKKLCLVPVSRLSRSFWSMHFGDESETNSLRHVTRNASAARNSKAKRPSKKNLIPTGTDVVLNQPLSLGLIR